MEIGSKIEKICEERNISINSLEKATGIGRGNIGRWDKHSPSFDKVALVANELNLSLDVLAERKSSSLGLSKIELQLLKSFNDLNLEGRTRVIEYAQDLVAGGRYIKTVNKAEIA